MFRRWGWLLMAPAGENDGGSGSGQTENGAGADGAEPVTEARVNEIVNKALSNRFRDFERKQASVIEQTIAKAAETITTTLTETLDQRLGKKGDGNGDQGKVDPGTNVDLSQHPQFRALERELEKEKKARIERDNALAAERAKNRAAALLTSVEEALIAEGVNPKRAKSAAKQLVKADELVAYESDDSDNIVFREEDGVNTLGSGIKGWLTSEDGKFWLDPRNPNGSGETPEDQGRTGRPRSGPPVGTRPDAKPSARAIGLAIEKIASRG